jgi:DNA mismatch repair ATPase MutS
MQIDGRHPLQELTVESFIPNDAFITHERSMAVLTGPNFSGTSDQCQQWGKP